MHSFCTSSKCYGLITASAFVKWCPEAPKRGRPHRRRAGHPPNHLLVRCARACARQSHERALTRLSTLSPPPFLHPASSTMFTALDYGEPVTRTFETPFGHAACVSTSHFLDRFLPVPPSDFDLGQRLSSLRRRRRLWKQLVTKRDRLWGYSQKDPSQLGVDGAYGHLQSCFEKLSTAFPGRNKQLSFVNNKESNWFYPERAEDALPDAYIEHTKRSSSAPWSSIAVCGVYQLDINASSLEHVRAFP